MDKAKLRLMLDTVQSPGWAHIVERAQTRLEKVKLAALATTDESKFLELYRKVHAAQSALCEWLEDMEAILEGELSGDNTRNA